MLPIDVRDRLGLQAGSPMLLLETPRGLVLATRGQVKQLVRDALAGASLVDELVRERRAAAADDR